MVFCHIGSHLTGTGSTCLQGLLYVITAVTLHELKPEVAGAGRRLGDVGLHGVSIQQQG